MTLLLVLISSFLCFCVFAVNVAICVFVLGARVTDKEKGAKKIKNKNSRVVNNNENRGGGTK